MSKLPIPFDNPRTYAGHSGVDYPQPRGTLIRASGPGVMGLRNTTPRGGITAWVDYDGFPGVAYAHLDNYQHTPRTGVRVQEGDVIAAVGLSGFTTGPHLHSEVYGHATTDGYWQFFDPSRVVGQGSGSGGNVTPLPPPRPPATEITDEDSSMNFYYETDPNLPYYLWNAARKQSRKLDQFEVVQINAANNSGIPGNKIYHVGRGWYDQQIANFGTYS